MKFTFEARNEQGQIGMLTLHRRGVIMEYWSFEVIPKVPVQKTKKQEPPVCVEDW